jgi:hypothetical protein
VGEPVVGASVGTAVGASVTQMSPLCT